MDPSSAQNGRRSQALFLLPPPLPPPLTSFTQPLALGNEPQRQLVRGLGCRPQIDSTFATWREVSPFWSSLAPSSNFCNRLCFQAVAFTGAEAPSHASWHPPPPESQWAAVGRTVVLAARLRRPGLAPERRLHGQAREGVRAGLTPSPARAPSPALGPCTGRTSPSARVFLFLFLFPPS